MSVGHGSIGLLSVENLSTSLLFWPSLVTQSSHTILPPILFHSATTLLAVNLADLNILLCHFLILTVSPFQSVLFCTASSASTFPHQVSSPPLFFLVDLNDLPHTSLPSSLIFSAATFHQSLLSLFIIVYTLYV